MTCARPRRLYTRLLTAVTAVAVAATIAPPGTDNTRPVTTAAGCPAGQDFDPAVGCHWRDPVTGNLRVDGVDGDLAHSHGTDVAAGSGGRDGRGDASVAPTCAGPRSRRFHLVYTYRAGRPNRIRAVQAVVRREFATANTTVFRRHRATGGAGARLRVACDRHRRPIVSAVKVSGTSFGHMRQALQQHGRLHQPNTTYVAFADYNVGRSTSGMATLSYDRRKSTANANNGRAWAIVWRIGGGWSDTAVLHEITHTMGAVLKDAPHSNRAAHCNDGRDVMCYAQPGTAGRYRASRCARTTYDCGADTYFDGRPARRSFLGRNWNVAGFENLYLDHVEKAPRVARIAARCNARTRRCVFTIGASDRNRNIARYRLYPGDGGGPVTSRRNRIVHTYEDGGRYHVRAVAIDRAGRTGQAARRIRVNSDPRVVGVSSSCDLDRTCTFVVRGADPDRDIVRYRVYTADGRGPVTATSPRLTHTYRAGGRYRLRVDVIDRHGHVGTRRHVVDVNSRPEARFAHACDAATCTFDASASFDPDGDAITHAWSFDGAVVDPGPADGPAATVTLLPGRVTAAATVTDPHGFHGTRRKVFDVAADGTVTVVSDTRNP